MCANYRPISLLAVGYKLFAALLLNRLRDSDAETRMSSTQFGFRAGRGTRDALFLARRLIDLAAGSKDFGLLFMALDWAKAFDSISPAAMCGALRRFGLPNEITDMIAEIYKERKFYVQEGKHSSSTRTQHFGILQGSPYCHTFSSWS